MSEACLTSSDPVGQRRRQKTENKKGAGEAFSHPSLGYVSFTL